MFEPNDLSNYIERMEFLAFKAFQVITFFGALWQVLDKHLKLKEWFSSVGRMLMEANRRLIKDDSDTKTLNREGQTLNR